MEGVNIFLLLLLTFNWQLGINHGQFHGAAEAERVMRGRNTKEEGANVLITQAPNAAPKPSSYAYL